LHTTARHVHVDHVFLAIAEDRLPAGDAAHEVGWFTGADASHVAFTASLNALAELLNRERAPDLVVHRMRAGKDAGHLLSAAAHVAGVPGTRRDQPLAAARLPG
jgi:hypothetical protein